MMNKVSGRLYLNTKLISQNFRAVTKITRRNVQIIMLMVVRPQNVYIYAGGGLLGRTKVKMLCILSSYTS